MIKKYFITGLLVLIPAILTIWVLYSLIQFLDQTIEFLPEHLRPTYIFGHSVPGFGVLVTVFVIFIRECRFKKSLTDRPDENLADPDVGKT